MRLVASQSADRLLRRAIRGAALGVILSMVAWGSSAAAEKLKVMDEPPLPMADGLVLEGAGDMSVQPEGRHEGSDLWELPPEFWNRGGADGATVEAELYWDDPSVVLTLRGLRGGQKVEAVSRTHDYAPTTYRRAEYIDTRVDELRIQFGQTESPTKAVKYGLRCVIRRAKRADGDEFDVRSLVLGKWMAGQSLSQSADHWWALSAPEGLSLSTLRFPNAVVVVALNPRANSSLATNPADPSLYDVRIYDAEWVDGQPHDMRLRKTAVQQGTAGARPPVCVMPLEDPAGQLTRGGDQDRRLLVRIRSSTSSPRDYRLQAYILDLGREHAEGVPGQAAPLDKSWSVAAPTEILPKPWTRRLIGRDKWGTRLHAFDAFYPGILRVAALRNAEPAPGVALSRDDGQAETPEAHVWSWDVGLESPVVVKASALGGPVEYTLEGTVVPRANWGKLGEVLPNLGPLLLSYEAAWRQWTRLPNADCEVTVEWVTGAATVDVDVYSKARRSPGEAYRFEQRASGFGDGTGGKVSVAYRGDADREYIAHVALNSRMVEKASYTVQHRPPRESSRLSMKRGVLERPPAAGKTYSVGADGPGVITLHVLTRGRSAQAQDKVSIFRAKVRVEAPVRSFGVADVTVTQYVLNVSSDGANYSAVVDAGVLALYYTWQPDRTRGAHGGGNDWGDTAERVTLPAGFEATLEGRIGAPGDRRDVWRVRLPKQATVSIGPSSMVYVEVVNALGKIVKRLDPTHPSMQHPKGGVVYLTVGPTTRSMPTDGEPYTIHVAEKTQAEALPPEKLLVFYESFVDYN